MDGEIIRHVEVGLSAQAVGQPHTRPHPGLEQGQAERAGHFRRDLVDLGGLQIIGLPPMLRKAEIDDLRQGAFGPAEIEAGHVGIIEIAPVEFRRTDENIQRHAGIVEFEIIAQGLWRLPRQLDASPRFRQPFQDDGTIQGFDFSFEGGAIHLPYDKRRRHPGHRAQISVRKRPGAAEAASFCTPTVCLKGSIVNMTQHIFFATTY